MRAHHWSSPEVGIIGAHCHIIVASWERTREREGEGGRGRERKQAVCVVVLIGTRKRVRACPPSFS